MLLLIILISAFHCHQITTKIKTVQEYKSSLIKNTTYGLQLTRISSSDQLQPPSCKSIPKHTYIPPQTQIFRLTAHDSTLHEKVMETLTQLDDSNDVIQAFNLVGQDLFLLNSKGYVFFINNQSTTYFKAFEQPKDIFRGAIIREYHGQALIVTTTNMALCSKVGTSCQPVEGYLGVTGLFSIDIFSQGVEAYIFISAGNIIHLYELTATNKLRNHNEFTAQKLGFDKLHITNFFNGSGNKLLMLDALKGLIELQWKGTELKVNKIVYQQIGCFSMSSQKEGQIIYLLCSMSYTSFFVMKLNQEHRNGLYRDSRPIFLQQMAYGLRVIENMIMVRVISGVLLYWTSSSSQQTYPPEYNEAGRIFLHNAKHTTVMKENHGIQLYISSDEQIIKYQLKVIEPYIECYNSKVVYEEYNAQYRSSCQNMQGSRNQNICSQQENIIFNTWQHKQIQFVYMILPFAASLICMLAIIWCAIVLYRRNKMVIQKEQLDSNTNQEQLQT